jgi:hypothetical protein
MGYKNLCHPSYFGCDVHECAKLSVGFNFHKKSPTNTIFSWKSDKKYTERRTDALYVQHWFACNHSVYFN